MRYSSLAFIAAIAVALPVLAEELPIQPDNSLTPGVVGSADFADVCGLVDGQTYSQRHRDTTQKMKNAAYVGITSTRPTESLRWIIASRYARGAPMIRRTCGRSLASNTRVSMTRTAL